MLQQYSKRILNPLLRTMAYQVPKIMTGSLKENDPEMYNLIKLEEKRQKEAIILIASENFAPHAAFECTGSVLSNKYSEGYPGARFYGGNQYIDQIENLCRNRALEAFKLKKEEWGTNVQSFSGSPANFAVYNALLEPYQRILYLDLPHGGHLSHGHQTATKKISATSKYFTAMAYQQEKNTGLIDYKQMEILANAFKPHILLAGASSYSRLIDYERMRKIADKNGSLLMADMAHIAGLVAADVIPSPFKYCDIVTTTTHKTLRGPRGSIIFFRKGVKNVDKSGKKIMWDLESKINASVFPSLQGGPHNHTIAAIATILKSATTPEYKEYQQHVLKNTQVLAKGLMKRGYNLVSNGTDNHLVLVDLASKGCDGARAEKVLEKCNIIINKNTTPSDTSAVVPNGIRLGTPAMTTRGFDEGEWEKVVEFIDRGITITSKLTKKFGKHKLAEFDEKLKSDSEGIKEIETLKNEITKFCNQFPAML